MSKIVSIEATTIPEGWEKSIVACWEQGEDRETEYDHEGDQPSKDITLILHITDPMSEPRIHRAMPGGLEDLEKYKMEVVDGISDHLIDPDGGKWSYTYSDRLRNYWVDNNDGGFNQLQHIVDTLAKDNRSRRSQAIIWDVEMDAIEYTSHSPCLQRIWCRLTGDKMDMHVSMRSNDGLKGNFMNMYAFTDLQNMLCKMLSEKIGRTITCGSYVHMVDSFHIYGSYFDEFKGFLKSLETRSFEQRTYRTEDVQDIIDEAHEKFRVK